MKMNVFKMTSHSGVMKSIVAVFLSIFSLSAFSVCDDTVLQTASASHFTNHRDGTVTDESTGLMWALCLYDQESDGNSCSSASAWTGSWDAALLEINQNAGGYLEYDGWRLPNVKELASILEAQCTSPSLNPDVFPVISGGSSSVWSSSPDMSNAQFIWGISFNANGDVVPVDRTTTHPMRLVRDADAASDPCPFGCEVIGF